MRASAELAQLGKIFNFNYDFGYIHAYSCTVIWYVFKNQIDPPEDTMLKLKLFYFGNLLH